MRLELSPESSAPATARRQIEPERRRLGRCFDDVVLVVSELVSNSVRHADTPGPIQVTLRIDDPVIRVEVHDEGGGFDPAAAVAGDGLGLTIVARLAAEWGIDRTGGTTVWAAIERARCAGAGAVG